VPVFTEHIPERPKLVSVQVEIRTGYLSNKNQKRCAYVIIQQEMCVSYTTWLFVNNLSGMQTCFEMDLDVNPYVIAPLIGPLKLLPQAQVAKLIPTSLHTTAFFRKKNVYLFVVYLTTVSRSENPEGNTSLVRSRSRYRIVLK
jgi:hypothetical protein